MPTSSDIGAKAWRKWWEKHMMHIPVYSGSINSNTSLVELNPIQQKNRQSHIDSCIHCQRVLRLSSITTYFAPLLFLIPNKQFGVIGFVMLRVLARNTIKIVKGG